MCLSCYTWQANDASIGSWYVFPHGLNSCNFLHLFYLVAVNNIVQKIGLSTELLRYSSVKCHTRYLHLRFNCFQRLTHLPLDKMASISQTIFSNEFPWMKTVFILIRFSLKLVPKGPIDNKWALVQVMAWGRIGEKQLPESLLIQFTDAYMGH